MTAGNPPAGNSGAATAIADDDTEGCLCLVAGYAKKDGLIARITSEAERRVMMSPALGDFLQLWHVDLGPRSGQAGDQSRAARRIVADLMAAQEPAGRSHFALIVIAKSAITVEGLLGSCAADPFLAGLRMRFAGIASSEDRERENGLADITSSPAGSWRDERELIAALRQRCEELPRYFAGRGEPGLTRAECATLRHTHAQPATEGERPEHATGDAPGESRVTLGETPVPDILDDAPGATAPASGQDAAAADTAGNAPAGAAAARHAAINASRWLTATRWRRGKQTARAGDQGAVAPAGTVRTAMGLIYLLMIEGQDAAADPALGCLQAALRSVDKRLAAEQSCGYQVRVIHGSDGNLRGELQDAGRLTRRAAKRSVKTGDFTAVLKSTRASLRRDRGLVETIATAAGLAVVPPTVVIFTANPPMAELSAAVVFADLAAETTMAWVVPGKLEGLVSPAFGTTSGATVLGEHQAVAEEILDVMYGNVLAS